jgi:cyclopropane fatty-acyl-phospholipid synthase-like methyltransferase
VSDSRNRYDQVLYPGRVYFPTHPDVLATCAKLLGLVPASVERCRVLELGCGDGTNLISMAYALPDAQFVGVDLSERATRMGRELAGDLGLTNVRFEQADLQTLDAGAGRFDYVISHGVYSWVSPEAQDALLSACERHLAEKGIAYVSYATYPGAHTRELAREMMLFHAGQVEDPRQKVERGIEFVRFVREAQSPGSAMAAMLDEELERLTKGSPEYVFHDDFSEFSIPVYFAAFASHAAAHGLKFLAEAHFGHFEDPRMSPAVRSAIAELGAGDPIAEQQYLDFAHGAAFRRTLLCRADVPIPGLAGLPERLLSLYAACPLAARSPNPDFAAGAKEAFVGHEGQQIETEEPLAKGALFALSKVWPQALEVRTLFSRAESLAGLGAPSDVERAERRVVLAKLLLRLAAFRVLYLGSLPPRFATSAGERPTASALAREQARRGSVVTSLRHLVVRLEDERSRRLVLLLDGTRTRADLLRDLCTEFADPTVFPETVPELTPSHLDALLARLAAHGLLVS